MAKRRRRTNFQKLESRLARKPGIKNPGALAASIGRKKLGKKKFQAKAARGRRAAARRRRR